MEIDEEDEAKTAFQVGSLGFFEFHRMPFGLFNATATFQKCLIYLDDVMIFSSSFEENIERLEAVFSRQQKHNLKLKASKCEFL